MNAIKIAAPALILILVAVFYFRDRKAGDKSIESYKRAQKLLLSSMALVATFMLVTAITNECHAKGTINRAALQHKKAGSLKGRSSVSDSVSVAFQSKNRLQRTDYLKQIAILQTRLNPFLDLASREYPDLSQDEALAKLTSDLQQQKPTAENPDQKASGRTFTQDQESTFVAYLRYYSPKQITITAVWGNQEAYRYATELKRIFLKAGWKVNGVNEGMYDNPVHGIILSVPGDSVPETAYAIWRAFTIIGVHLTGNKDRNQKPGDVALIIGSKNK